MKSIAWDIWLYCNYDCKFCNTKTKNITNSVKKTYEILDAWKRIYKKYGKCKIYITGGEPFLYPEIFDIIEKLTSFHDVHITTNLSFDVELLSGIKINKTCFFVNTTFHPCYVAVSDFISKFLKLQKYGYSCAVSYMSDDLQMAELLNYKKIFKIYGINIVPTLYNGNCKFSQFVKDFVVNDSISNETFEKSITNTGLCCDAGKNYVCIDSDGNAFVCSVKRQKIGNIFVGDFSFLEEAIECNEKCVLLEKKYC